MAQTARTVFSLLTLVGVFLLLQLPLPRDIQLWREIQNFGHVPLFGVLSLAMLSLSRQLVGNSKTKASKHYLIAFLLTILIGLAVELFQLLGDRDADFYDVLRDAIGALGFLGFYMSLDRRMLPVWYQRGNVLRKSIQTGSLMLLSISFVPLLLWTAAYGHRAEAFPQILGFESHWEEKFLRTQDAELSITWPPVGWPISQNTRVGRLILWPSAYPGLTIEEPYPNWTDYTSLKLIIHSEMDQPIEIHLRINDRHHTDAYEDRFSRSITLQPDMNEVHVRLQEVRTAPADREMDMANIATIVLFAIQPEQPYIINVDNLRLE